MFIVRIFSFIIIKSKKWLQYFLVVGGDVPQPDLERSMFTSFRTPSVLQVLRAWYIQLDAGTRHQATSKNVRSHSVHGRRLGSCTFVPQLSSDVGMFGALECEGSREVRRKMMDWTNYHTGRL